MLARRTYHLNSSELGCLLGWGRFRTLKSTYDKKLMHYKILKRFHRGEKCYQELMGYDLLPVNPYVERILKYGRDNEPFAKNYIEEKLPITLYETGIHRINYDSIDLSIGVSPDGIGVWDCCKTKTKFALEIKCPWMRQFYEEPHTEHLIQMMAQMVALDLDRALYVVYVPRGGCLCWWIHRRRGHLWEKYILPYLKIQHISLKRGCERPNYIKKTKKDSMEMNIRTLMIGKKFYI